MELGEGGTCNKSENQIKQYAKKIKLNILQGLALFYYPEKGIITTARSSSPIIKHFCIFH